MTLHTSVLVRSSGSVSDGIYRAIVLSSRVAKFNAMFVLIPKPEPIKCAGTVSSRNFGVVVIIMPAPKPTISRPEPMTQN